MTKEVLVDVFKETLWPEFAKMVYLEMICEGRRRISLSIKDNANKH